MQEQSSTPPTDNHGLNSSPKSKTAKYRSTRIPGWILAISLIVYGLISKFQDLLKNAPIPFKYDFLNTLILSILLTFFIIYMLVLQNNSKLKSKKLIEYLLEDLKYLILPTGFIFALFSSLDLKWFSDFSGFVSGLLGIFGVIKRPSNNYTQLHERTETLVDNLKNENYYSRIHAIQDLASIADDWIRTPDIPEEQARNNGKNIINILCEYVRSPFPLAQKAIVLSANTPPADYTGDFFADQATFREEQEVRRTIFTEMSKRGSTFTKNEEGDMIPILGAWSEFEFDFSQAPIFYPLREVKFTNANFNNAKFYGHTDFSRSQFYGETNMQHVDFYGPTLFDYTYFHNGLNLSFSHFHMDAGITSSAVRQKGIFCETHFHREAFFSDTDFLPEGSANFFLTKFHQRAVFNNTNFYGEAIFSADFMSSTSFEGAYFEVEPNFEYSQFSNKEEHNFETRESSPYHIKTEAKNHEGKLIKLPIGAGIYTSNVEKNLPSNNSKNPPEL